MVEGVTLPILLHWSLIREMRGDTTTIALPPATDLPDIRYSNQTEESGNILTPPVDTTAATRKHPIVQLQVAVLVQFRSTLLPEDIGEHTRELDNCMDHVIHFGVMSVQT